MSNPDGFQAKGALPPDGAFVLQLRAGVNDGACGADRARLAGRIEHIASGRTARFESLAELVAFIEGALASQRLRS